MKIIIEPFKIKSVEPICMNSKDDRIDIIKKADYNLFLIRSEATRTVTFMSSIKKIQNVLM